VVVRRQVVAQVSSDFVAGASLLAVAAVQMKGGQKKALARSALGTAAAQVLLAALTGNTFGVMVAISPPSRLRAGHDSSRHGGGPSEEGKGPAESRFSRLVAAVRQLAAATSLS